MVRETPTEIRRWAVEQALYAAGNSKSTAEIVEDAAVLEKYVMNNNNESAR